MKTIKEFFLNGKTFFKKLFSFMHTPKRSYRRIYKKAAASDAKVRVGNDTPKVRASLHATIPHTGETRRTKKVKTAAISKPRRFTGISPIRCVGVLLRSAYTSSAEKVRAFFSARFSALQKWKPVAAVKGFFSRLTQYCKSKRKQTLLFVSAGVLLICVPLLISFVVPVGTVSAESSETVLTVDSPGVLTAAAVEALEPVVYYSADPGMEAPIVADIQERLMELGYMGYDEPSEYYGEQTEEAIKLFQRKYELDITGIADETTFELLFSEDAKKYSVSEGTEGDDVRELQMRLVELSYLKEATGYFDVDTTEAVKKFQERNGLVVDGTIGEATREALYSEDANAYAFAYGEQSNEIKELQQKLKSLGYLTTAPDGVYGSDTVAAVKRFQERNGLIADGYLGNMTKSILFSDDVEYNSISIGDSGDDVTRIQKRLVELGYMRSATGYFGEHTEQALINFQKRNGLTADGKFGVNTNTTLFSSSAKRAATTTSNSSKTTGGSNTSNGTPANVSGANVASLISVAESRLGCRYVLGAKGPNQFDCSGLVYWCLNQIGLKQGYMTSYGWRTCTKYQKITSMGDIRAGDIIVYKISSSQGHVAIAISDSMMIDASTSKGVVVKRTFYTSYWKKYFYCAYRIF